MSRNYESIASIGTGRTVRLSIPASAEQRNFGRGKAETRVEGLRAGCWAKRCALAWPRSSRMIPKNGRGPRWSATNLIEVAASKSPSAVAAANEVCDRAEGRPSQHVQISDFAADLQSRSDQELEFYLANNRWPTTEELLLLRQPVEPTEM